MNNIHVWMLWGFPGSSSGKINSPANAGDMGSIPLSGRSPGWIENGNPLQYSCWENPMGRGARQAQFSSVQFCRSVMSSSLWLHGLQHARLPRPSTTHGVYSNSCPLSQWCHPTISSSVAPFSSCLQSFPASGSFPKSQLFASGGQRVGVSASTSVLPMNTQD